MNDWLGRVVYLVMNDAPVSRTTESTEGSHASSKLAKFAAVLAAAWLAWACISSSTPGGPDWSAAVLLLLGAAVVFIVALVAAIALLVARPRGRHRWAWAGALAGPIAIGLAFWAAQSLAPLTARVKLNRHELDQFAEANFETEGRAYSGRVGTFRVEWVGPDGQCLKLKTDDRTTPVSFATQAVGLCTVRSLPSPRARPRRTTGI